MSDHLKAARKALGLTQQQLAEQTGCQQSAISRYESGDIRPAIDVAPRLAAALGLSVLEILYPASAEKRAA